MKYIVLGDRLDSRCFPIALQARPRTLPEVSRELNTVILWVPDDYRPPYGSVALHEVDGRTYVWKDLNGL